MLIIEKEIRLIRLKVFKKWLLHVPTSFIIRLIPTPKNYTKIDVRTRRDRDLSRHPKFPAQWWSSWILMCCINRSTIMERKHEQNLEEKTNNWNNQVQSHSVKISSNHCLVQWIRRRSIKFITSNDLKVVGQSSVLSTWMCAVEESKHDPGSNWKHGKNAGKTIYVFDSFMILLFTLIFFDEKGNLASSCILNLIREKTIRSVGTDPGKGIMETKSITRDVRQIAYGAALGKH